MNSPQTPEFPTKWEALVHHMVENGGNVPAASELAGYTEVQSAYRALREPKAQEALVIGLRERLAKLGPAALASVLELAQRARSEKVRLDASVAILDRLGLQVEDRSSSVRVGEVNISVDLTGRGVGEKLASFTGHPLDLPQKGQKPEAPSFRDVEDAEITEIDDV